jgi:hypothetical protein
MSSRGSPYSGPTNLPPTALERAATKAQRAREKERQQDFDPYLDTRAGASPSSPTFPHFQSVDWAPTPTSKAKEREEKGSTTSTPTTHLPTVDWGATDEPSGSSGLGNARGGEVKRGVYEAWHLTYEPMRRPSRGLYVWECVKMNPAHFPTVAQEKQERRCETCGHWLAPVEWVESGGIGAG